MCRGFILLYVVILIYVLKLSTKLFETNVKVELQLILRPGMLYYAKPVLYPIRRKLNSISRS